MSRSASASASPGDAGFLTAHQDTGRARIVDFAKIDGFCRKGASRGFACPGLFKWLTASPIVRCVFTCTQLLLPAAAEAMVRIRLPGQMACTSCTPMASAVRMTAETLWGLWTLLHADRQIRLTPRRASRRYAHNAVNSFYLILRTASALAALTHPSHVLQYLPRGFDFFVKANFGYE